MTSAVVRRAIGFGPAEVPDTVLERTRQCVLDWFGVTIAGSVDPAACIALEVAREESAGGRATVVGTGERTGAQLAALVNGIAAHALDFDDSSSWAVGHPSSPVVPAALAVAEIVDATGMELLLAVLAGIDAASRVGVLVGKESYKAGWHGTGTIGTFGAAVAAARVLGLDDGRARAAVGLAGTQAAGLKAMFGTMGKPFHAGRAAMSGVLAAQLAAHGFTANPSVLEADQGFAAVQNPGFSPASIDTEIGDRWGVEAVLFKKHACCGGTHSTIDAIRRLRAERGFAADDVEEVILRVSPMIEQMCTIPNPVTGLEGKFSLRYTAGLALCGRTTGPSAFTDAAVADPVVAGAYDRVRVVPTGDDTDVDVGLELRFRDGTSVRERLEPKETTSDDELALQRDALVSKFDDLATPVLGARRTAELRDAVLELETRASVRELVKLAVGSAPGRD